MENGGKPTAKEKLESAKLAVQIFFLRPVSTALLKISDTTFYIFDKARLKLHNMEIRQNHLKK